MLGLILSLASGALVGWLAGKVMKDEGSLVRNIIVGVVGGWLGHFLLGLLGFATTNLIAELAVSVAGACLLMHLAKKFLK